MLASPDYDDSFYLTQNEMMGKRYSTLFDDLGLDWKGHMTDVSKRLSQRPYWIWNYLVGLERLIQGSKGLISSRMVDDHKDASIGRIIGDFYKCQTYVRQL